MWVEEPNPEDLSAYLIKISTSVEQYNTLDQYIQRIQSDNKVLYSANYRNGLVFQFKKSLLAPFNVNDFTLFIRKHFVLSTLFEN